MQQTSPSTTYRKRQLNLWRLLIRRLLLASFLLAGLAIEGCTPKLVAVKSDPCAGWSPIYPSGKDVLTDGTAKQILAHDLHGVQAGCWPEPAKKHHPKQ